MAHSLPHMTLVGVFAKNQARYSRHNAFDGNPHTAP